MDAAGEVVHIVSERTAEISSGILGVLGLAGYRLCRTTTEET